MSIFSQNCQDTVPVGLELQHRVQQSVVDTSAAKTAERRRRWNKLAVSKTTEAQYLYPAKDVASAPDKMTALCGKD